MTGPPRVRFLSQKIEARSNTDVVLQCHITAYPALTDIAWFVKNDCDDGEWIPIEAYVGAEAISSKERFSVCAQELLYLFIIFQ